MADPNVAKVRFLAERVMGWTKKLNTSMNYIRGSFHQIRQGQSATERSGESSGMPKRPTLFATPEQVRAFRAGAAAFLVPVRFPRSAGEQTLPEDWICTPVYCGLHITRQDRIVFNTPCGRSSKADQDRIINPPYAVGSVVAVKERWSDASGTNGTKFALYEATYKGHSGIAWQPARSMPAWAVRIHLNITAVAPQLVSGISEADALACGGWKYGNCPIHKSPEKSYQAPWQTRYGEKFPWAWLCRAEVKR